jgi:hypothetical protein
MAKWGMSRQGVLDYAKSVQDGTALQVALSKSWGMPGDEAAQSWRNALAALNAYLAALGAKPVPVPGPNSGSVVTSPRPDVAITNPFNPASATITAKAAKEQIETLTSLRKSEESGTAISFLLKEQIDTLTDSISTNSLNAFGDERARLRAMGTFDTPSSSSFDPAAFRMADNAGMTIVVNNAGSVITDNDLVETIRSGLLNDSASGKTSQFSARPL